MAYSFRKIFFIGQNLKHVHMTFSSWTFNLLLINSTVFRLYFFNMPNKYCMWIKTNVMGNQSWNKSKHFHLFLILMLKKSGFFNVKLILFMNNFYKHIFRSSRLQMFFKISALKNFAILRIKKRLQHRCFRVRSSHMMLTYW